MNAIADDSQTTGQPLTSSPAWMIVTLAWLSWLGTDLFFAHQYHTGIYTDPALTPFMLLGLLCQLAVIDAAAVLLVAGSAVLCRSLFRTRLVWLGKTLAYGLVIGTLFNLVASWSSYDTAGSFADLQGLRFSLTFPVATVDHAIQLDSVRIVIVVGVFLLSSLLMICWVPRAAGWLARRRMAAGLIHASAACLLAATVAGATASQLLLSSSAEPLPRNEDTGVISTVAQRWRYYRDDHLAPFPAFVADLAYASGQRRAFARLRKLSSPEQTIDRPRQLVAGDYAQRAQETRPRQWNVIVVLVESLRTDVVLATEQGPPIMPHLDELAARSLVYRDVYTQASHSNYADLCPLNSQFPLRSELEYFYPAHPRYPSTFLHQILAEVGYVSSVFSSQDESWGAMNNVLKPATFDRFFHAGEFSGLYFPRVEADGQRRGNRQLKYSGKIDDRLTAIEAVDWIGRQTAPFFMYVNLQSSHVPYLVPPQHPLQFAPRELGFDIRLGRYPRDKTELARGRYWDSLNYLDAQLGVLLDGIRQHGKADSTVLLISGDTGQAFNEHGFCAHANQLYNEVLQVPLVVSYPGVEPGQCNDSLQHVDLPPLVLSLLRLPPHPGFQGREFRDGRTVGADPPRFLVAQTTLSNQVAVVYDGWKLFYDLDYERFYLYDLENDPAEKHEVASQNPDRARQLATLLSRWVTAQLDYYQDPVRQAAEYPPRLRLEQ